MLTALVLLCSIGTTDCRNIAEASDQTELPFMCLKYVFVVGHRLVSFISQRFSLPHTRRQEVI